MIACDWCKEKKEGRWKVEVVDLKDDSYGSKKIVDVVLCDLYYEPIRVIAVKGGKDA